MLDTVKRSLRSTIIYGLGNISVKIVGFLLIPLYTNPEYLSIDNFGMLGLLEAANLILIALFETSLSQSLARWYWDKNSAHKQGSILFTSFVFQLSTNLLLVLSLVSFSSQISGLLFDSTDWSTVLKYLIISSSLQSTNNLINSFLKLESKPGIYSLANTTKVFVVLALTVFMIVSKGMGLEGIYLSQLIGNAGFIIFMLPKVVKKMTFKIEFHTLRSMLSYGFPLLFASLFTILLNVIDKYSLNSIATLKDVAIYTMAFKVASILKLVIVESFKMTISPLMIQRIGEPGSNRFYNKALLYSSFVLMLSIIVVNSFSLELLKIISKSEEYLASVTIIPILAFSIFFILLREIVVYGLVIVKKTKIVGVIVILISIVNLTLNILLIPKYNVFGAAAAALISQVLYLASIYYFSQRYYPISYDKKKIFILLVVGIGLSLISIGLNNLESLFRIVLKTLVIFSFPLILYLLNFYEKIELLALKGLFKKWRNSRSIINNIKDFLNNQ